MTSKDLIFISTDGILDTITVGPCPTVTDMWVYSGGSERLVIQLVGGVYQVYDLRTIQRGAVPGPYVIGPPVFITQDEDAAIMWALMNCGRETFL